MEAFPLSWPEGFPRTANKDKETSTFICTIAQARDGVLKQIELLKGKNPIISSNVPVKRDGFMFGTARSVDGDNGIAVYFTWDDDHYVLTCDKYFGLHENLRSIEKSIDALRGLKRWGASDILKKAFTGFKALPQHEKTWWQVLGCEEDSEQNLVDECHKLLSKKYHPDNKESGDNTKFIEVREAYRKFIKLKVY